MDSTRFRTYHGQGYFNGASSRPVPEITLCLIIKLPEARRNILTALWATVALVPAEIRMFSEQT